MITAKRLFGFLSLLLSIVILLGSCTGEPGDFPFLSADFTEITVAEYRIVIPTEPSAELSEAVDELQMKIYDKTQVKTTVYRYGEWRQNYTDVWDIFVGYSSDEAVSHAMGDMRSDDYTCRTYDKYIIIGGRNDKSTLAAIDRFVSEILPASDSVRLIPEGGGFDYTGSYPVESVAILGVSLSQYVIACDRDVSGEVTSAHCLRDAVSERTGYYLDIAYEELPDRRIMLQLDENCGEGEAYIAASEGGIQIGAHSPYGLRTAAMCLLNTVCPEGSSGKLSAVLDEVQRVSYAEPKLSFASACLNESTGSATVVVSGLSLVISEHRPDIVFFEKLSGDATMLLDSNLSSYKNISSEGGLSVYTLPHISAERIYFEQAFGFVCEAYHIKNGSMDMILLYIIGSGTDTTVWVPDELAETGLPIAAVSHIVNGGVTVRYRDNPFNWSNYEHSWRVDKVDYMYKRYIDSNYFSGTIVKTSSEPVGYRQSVIWGIS